MDELIEMIVKEAANQVSRLPLDEQTFVFSELSERFSQLSQDVVMFGYGLNEEDEQ